MLDRIDDDTHEVGTLLRQSVWHGVRTVLGVRPAVDGRRAHLVAGVPPVPARRRWPRWLVVRPLLPRLAARKVVEEMAWTDHAAAMEEGVAARDDLRTSLGQAHVLRRCTELAGHGAPPVRASCSGSRAGSAAAPACCCTACSRPRAVRRASPSSSTTASTTAALVTLFLVTTMFVGQVDQLARHLPDLQEGFGAVLRLRGLLAAEPEPEGGAALPDGPLDRAVRRPPLRLRRRHASRCATSTSPSPPARPAPSSGAPAPASRRWPRCCPARSSPSRGTVLLGGVDVLDLDLQQLRAAVGVVTQRTEILAGTLAENITLFAELPRATRRGRGRRARPRPPGSPGCPTASTPCSAPAAPRLSAGEEQLVAFARLLVRDVRVVVLDEATARMDPVTEARVVARRRPAARRVAPASWSPTGSRRPSAPSRSPSSRRPRRPAGPARRARPRDGPFRDLLTASAGESALRPVDAGLHTAIRSPTEGAQSGVILFVRGALRHVGDLPGEAGDPQVTRFLDYRAEQTTLGVDGDGEVLPVEVGHLALLGVDRGVQARVGLQRVDGRLREERHERQLHALARREVRLDASRSREIEVTSTSTTVVSCADARSDSTIRWAITLRRRVIGSVLPRSGEGAGAPRLTMRPQQGSRRRLGGRRCFASAGWVGAVSVPLPRRRRGRPGCGCARRRRCRRCRRGRRRAGSPIFRTPAGATYAEESLAARRGLLPPPPSAAAGCD